MKINLFPEEFPKEGFTLEELQQALNQIMDEENSRAQPQFEGYSPFEMFKILYSPFETDSPVSLRKLSKEDCTESPFYMQLKSLAEIIRREGSIKLTPAGNLPPKFVIELYNMGYFKENAIEQGWIKLKREDNSEIISLAHYILVASGMCLKGIPS